MVELPIAELALWLWMGCLGLFAAGIFVGRWARDRELAREREERGAATE
ncbi:MAG: hypothetical protein AB7O45_16065 [Alphaproteobacteria bacterium]